MDLSKLTSDELYKLAEQKKKEEERQSVPEVILKHNCQSNTELICLAESYMEDSLNGREIETNWAYELVMELVYGKDVFEYLNNLD